MKLTRILATTPLVLLALGTASLAFRSPEKALQVVLMEHPDAANAGLQGATGAAFLNDDLGQVRVLVDLGDAKLPAGAVLEGWLVDAGLQGGIGATSASTDDEQYGTPFGDPDFDAMVDNAPYALSTGVLDKRGKQYAVNFRINNNLTPFDAVVVTLESDGNGVDYDPRPGSIVAAGPINR